MEAFTTFLMQRYEPSATIPLSQSSMKASKSVIVLERLLIIFYSSVPFEMTVDCAFVKIEAISLSPTSLS